MNPNNEERRRHTKHISRAGDKKTQSPLEKELKLYRARGIDLYLDGERSNPSSIARACQIAEGGNYMRDYIEDEEGRIARVNFDYIKDS